MNEFEWQLLEDKKPVDELAINGIGVKCGSRVILRPRPGGDIMDIALAGKAAVIESIEQDYEGKVHLGVVVDDDPGRDIGMLRQPGHRFFFTSEEVDPFPQGEDDQSTLTRLPRILIAGIGNIFLGDDAFGVEVIRRLASHEFPESVRVIDFGIRSYDLTYALLDGYDTTILIDACPRGEPAGTLYLIEPDLNNLDAAGGEQEAVDAHALNPLSVLRMAKSMGGPLKRILLVGCEPATLGPEEGLIGLSQPVEQALDEAAKLVASIVETILSGDALSWTMSDLQSNNTK